MVKEDYCPRVLFTKYNGVQEYCSPKKLLYKNKRVLKESLKRVFIKYDK